MRINKRISHPSPPCDKLRKIVKFNSEFERSHPPPWRSQDIDDDEEEEKETDAESSVLLEVNVAEGKALQNRKIGRLKELRMFLLVLGEKTDFQNYTREIKTAKVCINPFKRNVNHQ